MLAADHFYVVTLADGTERNVFATGWAESSNGLSLQDINGTEVLHFSPGEWSQVRAMDPPEGEII